MESMISIKMNTATGGGGGGATVINEKLAEYSNCGRHEEEEEEYCAGEAFKEGEKMETAKAEMTDVREENVRLKMLLDKIEKDYKSLQMRFTGVFHSQTKNKAEDDADDEEPDQLVSLSLGRTGSREVQKKEYSSSSGITISKGKEEENEHLQEGLKLGLNYDYCCPAPKPEPTEEERASPDESSSVEANNKEEKWPPSKVKVTKPVRPGGDDDGHHHLSQPNVKRARVSVRARCDTPTMHDGCQWRKYGQKIAKGNPCPRAYYRCTVAPTCPVRKQVQRCADDMSILITTYEGNHNHPLPISATAMASTTSAAASMLLSGSSSSQSGLGSSNPATTSSSFHGLNVTNTRSLYLPNSSSSSSSPPFPIITLDLTTTTPTTHLNMFSTSLDSTPRFPSTSLSFSNSQPNLIPTVWGNGTLNNYGTILPSSYNKISTARPLSQESFLQNKYQTFPQQALTETLTKAITSDPSFRTVIAAPTGKVSEPQVKLRGCMNLDKLYR